MSDLEYSIQHFYLGHLCQK